MNLLWIIPLSLYLGLWIGRLVFMLTMKTRIITLRASKPILVRMHDYSSGKWEWRVRHHRLFQVRRRPAETYHVEQFFDYPFSRPERYEVCLVKGTRFLPMPPMMFFMDSDSVHRVWEDIGERAIARLDKPPPNDIDSGVWVF